MKYCRNFTMYPAINRTLYQDTSVCSGLIAISAYYRCEFAAVRAFHLDLCIHHSSGKLYTPMVPNILPSKLRISNLVVR